jgi:hypothetical protein
MRTGKRGKERLRDNATASLFLMHIPAISGRQQGRKEWAGLWRLQNAPGDLFVGYCLPLISPGSGNLNR